MSAVGTGGDRLRRIGWALSALLVLFLVLDAGLKIGGLEVATSTMAALGYPAALVPGLGVLLLVATVLYALPATALVGAVLLTGYLGGAVATHLRVGNPWLSHVLFGVYLGIWAWGALWLREPRLRALVGRR